MDCTSFCLRTSTATSLSREDEDHPEDSFGGGRGGGGGGVASPGSSRRGGERHLLSGLTSVRMRRILAPRPHPHPHPLGSGSGSPSASRTRRGRRRRAPGPGSSPRPGHADEGHPRQRHPRRPQPPQLEVQSSSSLSSIKLNSVKRALFVENKDQIASQREENRVFVQKELDAMIDSDSRRWGFNFRRDQPLNQRNADDVRLLGDLETGQQAEDCVPSASSPSSPSPSSTSRYIWFSSSS